MTHPPDLLDQIRQSSPLSTIVREYGISLHKAAHNLVARCPFHTEKTASFTVFPDDRGGHYFCFGCSKQGDVFGFIMAAESCSFLKSVEILAARAGIALLQPTSAEVKKLAEKRRLAAGIAQEAETFWWLARHGLLRRVTEYRRAERAGSRWVMADYDARADNAMTIAAVMACDIAAANIQRTIDRIDNADGRNLVVAYRKVRTAKIAREMRAYAVDAQQVAGAFVEILGHAE